MPVRYFGKRAANTERLLWPCLRNTSVSDFLARGAGQPAEARGSWYSMHVLLLSAQDLIVTVFLSRGARRLSAGTHTAPGTSTFGGKAPTLGGIPWGGRVRPPQPQVAGRERGREGGVGAARVWPPPGGGDSGIRAHRSLTALALRWIGAPLACACRPDRGRCRPATDSTIHARRRRHLWANRRPPSTTAAKRSAWKNGKSPVARPRPTCREAIGRRSRPNHPPLAGQPKHDLVEASLAREPGQPSRPGWKGGAPRASGPPAGGRQSSARLSADGEQGAVLDIEPGRRRRPIPYAGERGRCPESAAPQRAPRKWRARTQ